MEFKTKQKNGERVWKCFLCGHTYPNTLRYCPSCEIAKIHSDNLFESKKNKNH